MMVLARPALRWTSAAFLVVLGVSAIAGAIRLLPWALQPNIPWGLTAPFAQALFSSAVEIAALIALPVGWALTASQWTERGEARALLTLGVSPTGLALRTVGVAVLWVALLAGLGQAIPAESTGQFVADLIDRGRRECARASKPRVVEVPLAAVAWLCVPGQSPRVVGPVPRLSARAWFTAERLHPSADLREIRVRGVRVSVRGGGHLPPVRLAAARATIRGLPGWREARWPASPLRRALWLGASAVLTGLGMNVALLRRGVSSRVGSLGFGLGAGLASVAALHWVEEAPSASRAAWVAGSGLAVAFLVAWIPLPGRSRRALAGD